MGGLCPGPECIEAPGRAVRGVLSSAGWSQPGASPTPPEPQPAPHIPHAFCAPLAAHHSPVPARLSAWLRTCSALAFFLTYLAQQLIYPCLWFSAIAANFCCSSTGCLTLLAPPWWVGAGAAWRGCRLRASPGARVRQRERAARRRLSLALGGSELCVIRKPSEFIDLPENINLSF